MATSPLSIFRKYQYLALVALGVLAIVSFVVLPPISQYLASTRGGGRGGNEVVVRWANGKVREMDLRNMITAHVLSMNFLESVAQASMAAGGQPKNLFRLNRNPSEQAAMERMVLAEKASQLGVVISDQAIQDFIQQISDERLDASQLNEILRSSTNRQLTRPELFNQLRVEMLSFTMREMAFSGLASAPPSINWQHFRQLNETAKLEIVPLPVDGFVADLKAKPTDDELRRLYDQYKNEYRNPNTPEPGFRRFDQIDFGYFAIDFDQILEEEKAKITDEQVRAEYEQGLSRGDYRRPQLPPATPTPPAGTDAPGEGDPAATPSEDAPTTDEPADEQPAAPNDEPATDEPVTEEPAAEEAPAADEPAADETPTEEPADEPASEEEPAPAGCDVQVDDAQPETEDEAAQPVDEDVPAADEEAPVTDEAPAETSAEPAEQDPAAEVPDASAETPADPASPDANTETPAEAPQSEHRSLEEVRDQILRKLALPNATKRRDDIKNELRNKLRTYFQQYTLWKNQARLVGGETLEEPVQPDYQQLAQQFNVEFGRTGLLDVFEIQETELGKSSRFDFNARQIIPFVQLAYDPEIPLFQPREIESSTGSIEFIWWKMDIKNEYTPEFADIRSEVLEAWQTIEARKLADKTARELEKQAESAEGELAQRLPEYADRVKQTNEFSWLSGGNLGFQGFFSQPPRITSVAGVEGTDREFMQTVFGMKEGEIGVVTNAAETEYYVVRVIERSPEPDVLRQRFLREYPLGGMQQTMPLLQAERSEYLNKWLTDVMREMEVDWIRPPDQTLASVE